MKALNIFYFILRKPILTMKMGIQNQFLSINEDPTFPADF